MNNQQETSCPTCETEFMIDETRNIYCCDKCKLQGQYFEELKVQLRTLKMKPLPSVRITNFPSVFITLPITMIDEIPVIVRIGRMCGDRVHYEIEIFLNTITHYYDRDMEDVITLYQYYTTYQGGDEGDAFKNIKKHILLMMDESECWFDRYCGVFRFGRDDNTRLQIHRDNQSTFMNAFENSIGRKFVSFEDKQCVVCMKKTLGETKCGHSLCTRCLVGIDEAIERDSEDDWDGDVPCPMCRQNIRNRWKQGGIHERNNHIY